MPVVAGLPLPREPFADASARVNAWRGRCLDALTRAEATVTECLAIMAQVGGRERKVELPHLLGQRIEALAAAIARGGAFEPEGAVARSALEKFRAFRDFRNLLCHGVVAITLDQQGRWTAVIRLAALRSGCLHQESLVLDEDEATRTSDQLIQICKDLCGQVGQVKARLRKLSPAVSTLPGPPTTSRTGPPLLVVPAGDAAGAVILA